VLQTARAVIHGEGKPYRVRVLFDAGSHRSFISFKATQGAQLARIRQEWLGIRTFGQRFVARKPPGHFEDCGLSIFSCCLWIECVYLFAKCNLEASHFEVYHS